MHKIIPALALATSLVLFPFMLWAMDAETAALEEAVLCQAMPYRCTPQETAAPVKKAAPIKKVKPVKQATTASAPSPSGVSPVPIPSPATVDRLYTSWDSVKPGKRNVYEEVAIACMAASGVSPQDTLTPSTLHAFTNCVDLITGAAARMK